MNRSKLLSGVLFSFFGHWRKRNELLGSQVRTLVTCFNRELTMFLVPTTFLDGFLPGLRGQLIPVTYVFQKNSPYLLDPKRLTSAKYWGLGTRQIRDELLVGRGVIFFYQEFFPRSSLVVHDFLFSLCLVLEFSLHTIRSSETQLCMPNCKLFRFGQLRQSYETNQHLSYHGIPRLEKST